MSANKYINELWELIDGKIQTKFSKIKIITGREEILIQLIEEHNNKLKDKKYLFLDDLRTSPNEVYKYMKSNYNESYFKYADIEKWFVINSSENFIDFIKNNIEDLPEVISLDHDLDEEHYTPEEYWNDYERSKKFQRERYYNYHKPTGAFCLVFLLNLCNHKKVKVPKIEFHSQNPVGVDFMQYILHFNKKKRKGNEVIDFEDMLFGFFR